MKISFYLLILFLAACASKSPVIFPRPVENKQVENENSYEPPIDYDGLQTFLNLERPAEQLGYTEKKFPTCEVGYGYSSNKNCRNDYFVLIHFKLLCRDSSRDQYTTALGSDDMRPLSGRLVKWSLNSAKGSLYLDENGQGQIRTTASNSPKNKRLKLNIENDNLYMKAGEMSKVVTPSNWCH
jgi:hypothetical protein